uniref:Uncharacterized protein n=1 Tax=Anguilla anguilla TaxID=7936 RepID=A0A0E9URR7_ANGAN
MRSLNTVRDVPLRFKPLPCRTLLSPSGS